MAFRVGGPSSSTLQRWNKGQHDMDGGRLCHGLLLRLTAHGVRYLSESRSGRTPPLLQTRDNYKNGLLPEELCFK